RDQRHLRHLFGMPLGVREGERYTPRSAGDKPAVDAEVRAQSFHVGDEVVRGVRVHRRTQIAGRGSAAAAASLVERHDPVARRIEPLPVPGSRPLTRAAVQHYRGLAVRVAGHGVIDTMSVADVEPSFVMRLTRREKVHHATINSARMEHVDVLVVGAGLSGVGAACHLTRNCPDKTFAVVEARDRLGGTWDLFRYPGIRSDSDMFTLGYSFKPWTEPKAIADGPAILDYITETAREYDVLA